MASETITRNDLTAILSEVFQPIGNIRQIKTDVAVPAISGGGYTTVAVPSPSLDVGEVVIGNRLIETDAALQVTLRYSNGWWLNASNEYSGTASAHNVEVWWVVLKNGAVTGVNDYIVEQDTSGIWTYRKWNSGIAECWGQTASTSKVVSTSYGSGFYAPMDTILFPSGLFTSVDSTNVTVFDSGAIGTWFEISGLTTTDVKGYLWGIRSNTANFRYEIHAYGRWK